MLRLKRFLKKFSWYKELRYIYRSFIVYKKPFAYLYYRFYIGPKIRRLKHPIDKPPTDDSYSIHLLCSHSDLTMMLWSLASWYKVVPNSGQVYIHEDGSFTIDDRNIVSKILPFAKIIDASWANEQAENVWLADMPNARKIRTEHPEYKFFLKLTDPFFTSQAPYRLIVDTDILWFKDPADIAVCISKGVNFMMRANSPMDFSFKDGSNLESTIALANSGVVGYQQNVFDSRVIEGFLSKVDLDNPPA